MMTWLVLKFIFFPSKPIEFWPGQFDLPFEEVNIGSTDDATLHGWFIPGGPPNRTLIYYHGNAGNIGDRLAKLKILHGIGMNIFIFDYRGYGGSIGDLSFQGVVDDSLAAYHYVESREDVDPKHIILYGESLGGAMALKVAQQEEVAAVILESTFTSIKDMARRAYSVLSPIAPDIYRSIDIIPKIHVPILIMHGTSDKTVPFVMGDMLYKAAPQPKRFVPFEGAEHTNIHEMARDKYIETIDTFMAEIGQ